MLTLEEKEYQSKLVNRLGRIANILESISDSLNGLYLIMLNKEKDLDGYACDLEADFELNREN